jgi:hypothetical protein
MATCENEALDIGRNMIVAWAPGCGNDDPTQAATPKLPYKALGYTTTKNINDTTRTVSANNDSSGPYEKELQVGRGVEIPVSVFSAKDVADVSSHEELRDYRNAEIDAGRQATVWLWLTDPQMGVHRYFFCLVNDTSRSFENEGVNSGDFNFKMIATDDPTNPPEQKENIV